MIASTCKYFQWSEKDVLNMSYEKFIMYLSTIPDLEEDGEENKNNNKNKATGSFNLFDFDQR